MISFLKKLSYQPIILFSIACANVQSPSGGPSDKKPPELKLSDPEPNTKNFTGKEITLEFDEEVAADKLQEALVITPYKEGTYKVRAKKKKVTVKFDTNFDPNTTYTLNFQDAIQDLTEKNSAKDLTLAFSTGNYLDSISLNGTAKDLQTNQPLENVTIALYNLGDTTSPKTGKPYYFLKTDKTGKFNFKNLKNNSYNLYAFQDKNGNLHYDENEKISITDTLNLSKNISNLTLTLTKLDTQAPELTYIKPGKEKTDLKFNEGIIINKINYLDSLKTTELFYKVSEDAKTISIFNNINKYDSIPININLSDSTGNQITINKKIIFEKKSNIKEPFNLSIDPSDLKFNPGTLDIKFEFNKPIKKFTNNINITSNGTLIQIPDSTFKWNENRTRLTFTKNKITKDTIKISTNKETFISMFNDSLNEQKLIFTIKKEEDYGILKGSIETKQPHYILELLDKNYKLHQKLTDIKTFEFNYLNPGIYFLRIIVDVNNNGKWDNGNMKLKQQPETIIYYDDRINLRANWEIENIKIKF